MIFPMKLNVGDKVMPEARKHSEIRKINLAFPYFFLELERDVQVYMQSLIKSQTVRQLPRPRS